MVNLSLSKSAIKHISKTLLHRSHGLGIRIRIRVVTSGCSGLAYKMEFVDKANSDDDVIVFPGFSIFVDTKSSVYLNGTFLNFNDNGLKSGFEFVNPNEQHRCGCGESFSV